MRRRRSGERQVQTAIPYEEPVILWRDSYALAADKPAGLLVHADGSGTVTLTDIVRNHLGEGARPQALNRLDVPTSGIVLFSLDKATQPAFDAIVAGHAMSKRYWAVVDGRLPKPGPDGWVLIDASIARDRHNARRMRVGRTGKQACTRIRPLARRGRRTLVEAELITGRKHQIRVHLAHVGCPIVGDELYGGTCDGGGLMLHAHELAFDHPITGECIVVRSEMPTRFNWPN